MTTRKCFVVAMGGGADALSAVVLAALRESKTCDQLICLSFRTISGDQVNREETTFPVSSLGVVDTTYDPSQPNRRLKINPKPNARYESRYPEDTAAKAAFEILGYPVRTCLVPHDPPTGWTKPNYLEGLVQELGLRGDGIRVVGVDTGGDALISRWTMNPKAYVHLGRAGTMIEHALPCDEDRHKKFVEVGGDRITLRMLSDMNVKMDDLCVLAPGIDVVAPGLLSGHSEEDWWTAMTAPFHGNLERDQSLMVNIPADLRTRIIQAVKSVIIHPTWAETEQEMKAQKAAGAIFSKTWCFLLAVLLNTPTLTIPSHANWETVAGEEKKTMEYPVLDRYRWLLVLHNPLDLLLV